VKVERDGIVLVVDDTGEDDLDPVVLMHGLSTSRETWARLTGQLRGRYRIVAFDDRGHGESTHATGTYVMPTYTGDAIAVLEQVVAQPAVLVGHSLGGVIAVSIAQSRPDLVRGVVLEDPPLFVASRARDDDGSPMVMMFQVMQQVIGDMQARGASIDEYEAMVRAAPAMGGGAGTMADLLGEEGTRAQARAMAGLDPDIFTPALDGSALAGVDGDVPLGVPAIVLRADDANGAAFSADDATRFVAANPAARVVLFEGSGHAVHDQFPDRFLAEVEGFLATLVS
jgi:pimeloyl-ACP methyl ester carboxylesterase